MPAFSLPIDARRSIRGWLRGGPWLRCFRRDRRFDRVSFSALILARLPASFQRSDALLRWRLSCGRALGTASSPAGADARATSMDGPGADDSAISVTRVIAAAAAASDSSTAASRSRI